MLSAMTYKIEVVVHEGMPEAIGSGEIPDGVYVIAGTPDTHGPAPSVRFVRPENYTGTARSLGAQEGGL